MSNASDIKNLFAKFGGHPEHYRELAIENDAQASAARWPLLSSIVANRASHPPPVSPSPFQTKPKPSATPGPEAATLPGAARPPYLGFSAVRQAQAQAVPTAAGAPAVFTGQPPPVARPLPTAAPVAQATASTPLQGLLQRLSAPPQPAPVASPVAKRGTAPVSTLLSRLAKR